MSERVSGGDWEGGEYLHGSESWDSRIRGIVAVVVGRCLKVDEF